MKLKQTIFTSLLAVPALLVVSSAQATPVTGEANIAGSVSVNLTTVNFNPTFTSTTGGMETGDFAGLTGGTIMSLSGGPATGPVNIPGFAHFTTGVATPVTFDLTFISPGVGTIAGCASSTPGAECTPIINGQISPFTLFQLTSNTVVATLQLNGISFTNSAATGSSDTVSVFSTQTAINGTIPGILAQLAAGTPIQATYSASFVATPIPEPASMLLVGIGLVGAGLIARRRFAK